MIFLDFFRGKLFQIWEPSFTEFFLVSILLVIATSSTLVHYYYYGHRKRKKLKAVLNYHIILTPLTQWIYGKRSSVLYYDV